MKDIAIIGGGIAGLCTALALHKVGLPVTVYERAPQPATAGAGILMAANARKVFRWLGIDDQVRDAGCLIERMDITNEGLRPLRNSTTITKSAVEDQGVAIHRGALQAILLSSMPDGVLHEGAGYECHDSVDGRLEVMLSDGSVVNCDLLLGADGLRSMVRAAIFPESRLRYSGQTSWRGVLNRRFDRDGLPTTFEAWGKAGRFGVVPIGLAQTYWFAVQSAEANQHDGPDLKDDLKTLFQDFHPIIQDVIEQTPTTTILRTDIWDLRRLGAWHHGPVCLIGDAAHAATPNYGQGGAQAVEDAWYLSNLLARTGDPHAAFASFDAMRRTKVDMIVNGSWRFGQLAHSPIGQPLLKTMLRLAPESSLRKMFLKLQHIDET